MSVALSSGNAAQYRYPGIPERRLSVVGNAKSLSPNAQAAVRAALRVLLHQHGKQTDLAKLLNIKQQTISSVNSGTSQPGVKFAMSVAAALGVPLEAVLSGPMTPDAYPARAAALLRLHGLLLPATVDALRAEDSPGATTWTVEDWVREAMGEQDRQRRALAKPVPFNRAEVESELQAAKVRLAPADELASRESK